MAISRCGASTSAELEFLQVPFIAIPYPFATDNHQYQNALYYQKKGCCWILDQKNLKKNNLCNLLLEILKVNILENKRKEMKSFNYKKTHIRICKRMMY